MIAIGGGPIAWSAVATYAAFSILTGVAAYEGYKLYDSYQQSQRLAELSVNALASQQNLQLEESYIASKITDVYAPDRPLPKDEDGIAIPDTDASHTQLGTKGSKRRPGEQYPQAREFDTKGNPIKTIDFTDHGEPLIHPNPHEHPCIPNPTGGTPKRGEPRKVDNWRY